VHTDVLYITHFLVSLPSEAAAESAATSATSCFVKKRSDVRNVTVEYCTVTVDKMVHVLLTRDPMKSILRVYW
jgi:hypothetical protein